MKKITKQEALAKDLDAMTKVLDFLRRMKALELQPWDISRCKVRDELLADIDQFDRSLGPGLSVGRLVTWPLPGGSHASYFVIEISRSYVHLVVLDDLKSPVVAGGRALRLAVERALYVKDWHRIHPHGVLIVNDD
jgi:hypothetical protein